MICVIPTTPERSKVYLLESYASACQFFDIVTVLCDTRSKAAKLNDYLRNVTAEYACICDDDDIVLPGIEHAKTKLQGDYVHGDYMFNETQAVSTYEQREDYYNIRGLTMLKVSTLQKYPFSEIREGADYELYFRWKALGLQMQHVNAVTHYWRQHPDQMTQEPNFKDRFTQVQLLGRSRHIGLREQRKKKEST